MLHTLILAVKIDFQWREEKQFFHQDMLQITRIQALTENYVFSFSVINNESEDTLVWCAVCMCTVCLVIPLFLSLSIISHFHFVVVVLARRSHRNNYILLIRQFDLFVCLHTFEWISILLFCQFTVFHCLAFPAANANRAERCVRYTQCLEWS